jgi:lincosamide and streptogramin A transport system ATP-binding/permease protein
LKIITGEVTPDSGSLDIPGSLTVAQARQIPLWNSGLLREHLYENKMDETKFRNILGSFGSGGDLFERPLETFSMGELKKVELCRSFVEPVDLLIWDEPMNYIDIAGRESIEKVILESTPTMIFIEHDKAFIENVSTNIIEFSNILIK